MFLKIFFNLTSKDTWQKLTIIGLKIFAHFKCLAEMFTCQYDLFSKYTVKIYNGISLQVILRVDVLTWNTSFFKRLLLLCSKLEIYSLSNTK